MILQEGKKRRFKRPRKQFQMMKAGVFGCLSYRVILQYVTSNAILLYIYQAENKEELTHKKESNTNQQSIKTRDNQKVI